MTKEEMKIQIHQFAEMMYRTGYVDGLNHNKPMYEVDYEKFFDPNDKKCFEHIPIWERDIFVGEQE